MVNKQSIFGQSGFSSFQATQTPGTSESSSFGMSNFSQFLPATNNTQGLFQNNSFNSQTPLAPRNLEPSSPDDDELTSKYFFLRISCFMSLTNR